MEAKRATSTPTIPQVYNDEHSKGYREYDELFLATNSYKHYKEVIASLLATLPAHIAVLDVGCGTGRFFHLCKNAAEITGIDYSEHMLKYAAAPLKKEEIAPDKLKLIHGSFIDYDFGDRKFDFIYSVGVLGEHIPFNVSICNKLYDLLNINGKVFFTNVDLASRKNFKRRTAEAVYKYLPGFVKSTLDKRWETNYVTYEQLDDIMGKSKFKKYAITLHKAEDPAWKGAHLECIATK